MYTSTVLRLPMEGNNFPVRASSAQSPDWRKLEVDLTYDASPQDLGPYHLPLLTQ